jgi:DegV family protein with EDD domain
MKKYKIISDGSCDLTNAQLVENDIINVPFYVSFNKEESLKEGIDISKDEFYKKELELKNVFPTSSCPSPNDFYVEFEKCAKNKMSIICICITKKFSSSFSSASIAKDMILEKYKDIKITIIDSRVNTVLQGLFVLEAARMQQLGMSYSNLIKTLQATKGSRIFFTVSNLDYLVHGGRIGKLSAFLGKIFQINPLIVLKHGEIYSGGVALQRKRAELSIIRKVKTHFETNHLNVHDYRFVVGYGYNKQEAIQFANLCQKELSSDVEISQIGATIAVHTGPNPLGIAFVKKFTLSDVLEPNKKNSKKIKGKTSLSLDI